MAGGLMMGALTAVGALSALLAVHFPPAVRRLRRPPPDGCPTDWTWRPGPALFEALYLVGDGGEAAGLGPSNAGRNRGRRRVRPIVCPAPCPSLRRTQKVCLGSSGWLAFRIWPDRDGTPLSGLPGCTTSLRSLSLRYEQEPARRRHRDHPGILGAHGSGLGAERPGCGGDLLPYSRPEREQPRSIPESRPRTGTGVKGCRCRGDSLRHVGDAPKPFLAGLKLFLEKTTRARIHGRARAKSRKRKREAIDPHDPGLPCPAVRRSALLRRGKRWRPPLPPEGIRESLFESPSCGHGTRLA